MADRSSRPHHSPRRLSAPVEAEIEALRRQRLSGPAIARRLGRPVATIGVVLRRRGLGRLEALDPKPAVIRYQRDRPGELIHIDIKKLGRIDGAGHRPQGGRSVSAGASARRRWRRISGDRRGQKRGAGWEFLHVCIDDASRLAYTEILPDERKESAVAFLERALAWYATLGVTVERVMTDNGSTYRSHLFRRAIGDAGLKHKRTRPYRPQTIDSNAVDPVPQGTARQASRRGKAERFIQTSLREWAYLQAFESSAARSQAMRPWLHRYNTERPHAALAGQSPLTRLNPDNLHSNDS